MATPTRVQTLRSSVKGQRPTTGTREPGELYVSFPDRQFGVIDAGKAALDMIPVRFFSPNTDYVTGDFVWQAGNIYRAKAAVPAGAFNPAQWDKGAGTPADLLATLLTVDGTGSGLDADLLDGHDSPYFAIQSDMTAVQNKNTAQDSAIALKLDASAYTAADVLAKVKTVDGPGSGLDADLLDGLSSADFMQAGSGYTKSQSDLLYVNVLGDSMTGDLLLPGTAPSSSTAAAPKSYVDAQVATKLSDAPNDGLTYGRKSAAWATIVGGAVVSDTAPAGPLQAGQLWWESDSGNTFIWYNDGDTSQWVQQNVPPPGSTDTWQSQFLKFSTTAAFGGVWFTSADIGFGFRTAPNQFVWNSAPDLSGTDIAVLDDTGRMAIGTAIPANTIGSLTTSGMVSIGSGLIGFNAYNDGAWKTINAGWAAYLSHNYVAGTITLAKSTGSVAAGAAPTMQALLSFASNGDASFPQGSVLLSPPNIILMGTFTNPGTSAGTQVQAGRINTSNAGTAGIAHLSFYNGSGNVGQITTSGSATAYGTSSDETLKDFIGPYDPLKAIEIIRADPVRDFTWKSDGAYAVGWGAQTSHAISLDLAVPGNDKQPDDPDFLPWSMDQSRRAPYLWAALAWALDRIDDLEARLTALEAA